MLKHTSSIRDLYGLWIASNTLWESSLQTADERMRGACLDNVTRLIPIFSQTDANCLADVVKKLKVWLKHRAPGEKDMVDLTPEDLIIVSVIRDLDRMCDSAPQNFEKVV